QGLLRRLSRSLLQYLADAYPWTRNGDDEALGQLRQLIQEQRDAALSVARFLQKNRVTPPYLGAFPMAYTDLAYIALDHLLPKLVEEERRAVAELERAVGNVPHLDTRALVQKILDLKRGHLKALEALAAAHPDPVKS